MPDARSFTQGAWPYLRETRQAVVRSFHCGTDSFELARRFGMPEADVCAILAEAQDQRHERRLARAQKPSAEPRQPA